MSGLNGQGDTGRQLEQVVYQVLPVLTNLASQVMAQLKEGMEGNALKVNIFFLCLPLLTIIKGDRDGPP